jgi:hypothetical protein
MVGLSNVDNTSDANKANFISNTNSFRFKANLARQHLQERFQELIKTMVGLGNVDNTRI